MMGVLEVLIIVDIALVLIAVMLFGVGLVAHAYTFARQRIRTYRIDKRSR